MSKVVIHDPVLKASWAGKDLFAVVDQLEGEEFRRVKTRRTFRFEVEGKGFFAKVHHGVGWKEILKNLIQFKLPVLGAENEYLALQKLNALGVSTMTCAAYGCRNWNPAAKDSFLITNELEDMISLEDLAKTSITQQERHILISLAARSAGIMHASGINHRDCYICHYLIRKGLPVTPASDLFVIDLHRAQIRKKVPWHFWVKDVAGLYFSSMDVPLSDRDRLRFIAEYSRYMKCSRRFWKQVERTAEKLYRKEHRNSAAE